MRIIPFWTRQKRTLTIGLHSALTDSINTPELDAFFDEADAVPSSGFYHLDSAVLDTSLLQLAHGIKCCKLWCQIGPLHLPVL